MKTKKEIAWACLGGLALAAVILWVSYNIATAIQAFIELNG